MHEYLLLQSRGCGVRKNFRGGDKVERWKPKIGAQELWFEVEGVCIGAHSLSDVDLDLDRVLCFYSDSSYLQDYVSDEVGSEYAVVVPYSVFVF